MFCRNCGRELTNDAKFCDACGEKVVTMAKAAQRKEFYDGEVHKCPNCGEVLNAFTICCDRCGYELRGVKISDSVQEFSKRLEMAEGEQQRINLIRGFAIPNTKEDIIEFMTLAMANFDAEFYVTHLGEEDVSDAWLAKIEQCYQKAKTCFKEDKIFKEIEGVYCKIFNKINKLRCKKRKKFLIIVGGCFAFLLSLVILLLSVGAFKEDPNKIKAGVSYSSLKGQYYMDAIEMLENSGFSNISVRDDCGMLCILHKKGEVLKVTIDGDEEFYKFSKFNRNATVVIFYHG